VALSSRRDVSNAFQLSPRVCVGIVRPYIVKPGDTVSTAEPGPSQLSSTCLSHDVLNSQVKPVAPCDHCVICSRWWDLTVRRSAVDRVLNQNFPPITCLLQRVQIERNQIIEKVAFDLTSEDVKLTTQDVQGMSVASWRARSCRKCS
jgi:hypothetical protein